jgi:hypothetical protein
MPPCSLVVEYKLFREIMFLLNVDISTKLHDVAYQKSILILAFTSVRTPDLCSVAASRKVLGSIPGEVIVFFN